MSGPVALVTGATRGIGFGAALALARDGFAVAVNGPEDDAELQGAVEQVGALGGKVLAAPFDVADLETHDGALTRIEAALGPVTTLVNNAGVGVISRGDPLEVSPASWDRCHRVNARAVFFLTPGFRQTSFGARKEQRAVSCDHQCDLVKRNGRRRTAGRVLRVEGRRRHGVADLGCAIGGRQHRRL